MSERESGWSTLPAAGRILALLRLAVGGGGWAAPRLAGSLFGLETKKNPAGPYLGRLFAVRDAGLGIGLIAATARDRRVWWPVNIAADFFDLLALVASRRRGELDQKAVTANLPAILLALSLGIAGKATDTPSRRASTDAATGGTLATVPAGQPAPAAGA